MPRGKLKHGAIRMTTDDVELRTLITRRPTILVFLPNTNELQRFVVAGAFADLASEYDLRYVVPVADRAKMMAAAPDALREDNTFDLEIAPERFAKWSETFGLACQKLGGRSRSFAIRANITTFDPRDPAFYDRWPRTGRKLLKRAATRLSRSTVIPVRPRRMLATLGNLFDGTGRRWGGVPGDDLSAYQQEASRIIGDLEPHEHIVELLDRQQPLLVIIPTSLLDLFCNDVLFACASENVACLLLQSGWDNMSSKGIIHHMPTIVGSWGPQSSEHAVEIQQARASIVFELGAPHYEFLKPATPVEVAKMRRSLGVSDNERLVLFGGSFRQFDETNSLLRLDAAITEGTLPPMKIVYRPHPWRADRQDEGDFFEQDWQHVLFDPDMRDRYQRARAERGYLKRNVPMFDMSYLAQLLTTVEAVISPMSTLLIEALLLDRPTMAVAFGDGKHAHNPSITAQMTHFSEIKHSPALVWCSDSAAFERDVARLFQPGFAEQTAEKRRRLLSRIVQLKPGTYSERLRTLCRNRLERTARKQRAQRASKRRGHISHAYGANLIARDFADVHLTDPQIPGYWMHGWIPAYHNIHPALIALHKKDGQGASYDYEGQIAEEKETTQQWVSRRDQADFLVANGYKHVRAIGLPITYITDPEPRRIPDSLLVMPPHSHKSHGADDPLAEAYADHIAGMAKHFSHVWVCLHEDDIAKGQWLASFRKRGIGVFPSADQSDPYTLRRLRRVLSSFEYITTNGYGSHIAYAAFCGAKVSISGPFAEFPKDRMTATHAIKMFPELRDAAYDLCTECALRVEFPFLFTEPHEADLLKEWGAEQVGASNRLAPAELALCFKWSDAADAEVKLKRGSYVG